MRNIDKKLLTIKEVCEYLNVSKPTIYRLIKEGKLKPIKIGRATRFDKEDIDKFIEEQKRN